MLAQRTKRRPPRQTPMADVSRDRPGLRGSRFRLLEHTPLQPEAVDESAGGPANSPRHTQSVKERADLEIGHRVHTERENSQSNHADTCRTALPMFVQPTEGSSLEGANLELQGRMGNNNVKSDSDTKHKLQAVEEYPTKDKNGARNGNRDQRNQNFTEAPNNMGLKTGFFLAKDKSRGRNENKESLPIGSSPNKELNPIQRSPPVEPGIKRNESRSKTGDLGKKPNEVEPSTSRSNPGQSTYVTMNGVTIAVSHSELLETLRPLPGPQRSKPPDYECDSDDSMEEYD